MRDRPVGITIIAILTILVGLAYVFGALTLFGVTAAVVPGMEAAGLAEAVGISAGVVLIVMAVLNIIFGIGALMLKSWAWMLGVVLFGITLVANLFMMFTVAFTIPAIVMALIAAAVLGYLFTDGVRSAFGRGGFYYGTHRHGGPVVHI